MLTNINGEKIEGVAETVKTIYKYSFTVETVGDFTCVVTFTHNNKNYADIAIELKAWIFISEVA